MYAYP